LKAGLLLFFGQSAWGVYLTEWYWGRVSLSTYGSHCESSCFRNAVLYIGHPAVKVWEGTDRSNLSLSSQNCSLSVPTFHCARHHLVCGFVLSGFMLRTFLGILASFILRICPYCYMLLVISLFSKVFNFKLSIMFVLLHYVSFYSSFYTS
jgi:hypothetical protein